MSRSMYEQTLAENIAYEEGIQAGIRMAEIKTERHEEGQGERDTIRDQAWAALSVTDPTGHVTRPAEVRIQTPPTGRYGAPEVDPYIVVLDYGPFMRGIPFTDQSHARAVALAFIHLLGADRVEYDLTALEVTNE